jgi:hypothetical protein
MKRSLRLPYPFALVALVAIASPARALDLVDTCHADSSYDLTLVASGLVFERASPAPRRIELRDGGLSVDGARVRLNTEDADRLDLFANEVRALVPKVKAIALRGLDLATNVVRNETRTLVKGADARSELDQRIAQHSAQMRKRIATSNSTRDWQVGALERDVEAMAADVAPLLTADLGGQAVTAALSGDVDAAVALQSRAAELDNGLQPKIEARLRELQPDVAALCPAVRRLHELQQGVRDGNGRPLDLVQIDGR